MVKEQSLGYVECIGKWYGIIDKVVFEMVKQNNLKKLDVDALNKVGESGIN